MKTKLIIFLAVIFMSFTIISDKPAYLIYTKDGKQADYKIMLEKLKDADIVFIGELHNNPISHWMELEITKDLFSKNKEGVTLGAEMFESDNQLIIDEYLNDYISKKSFKDEARLWPNYKTDYKPLMEFAKKNKLKFIATNIPRRYASVMFKKGQEGIDKLSDEAKKYIAPIPFLYDPKLKCYADMIEMGKKMGHTGDNFPKSQAIKDATMAHFILKNMEKGKIFIHYNGSYHSDNFEGIVWHIKHVNKKMKIMTVSTVSQNDISKLEKDNFNKADYIIAVPESMTTTH